LVHVISGKLVMDMIHKRGFLLVLLVGFWAAPLGRAADWPVARGPSREPVPYQYDAKAWQQVPKEFLEDAPACTLYAGVTHTVEEDGTIETVSHEITRLSSRKALDRLGEYRNITYTPAYEKLTLNEARVLKADGRIFPVEAQHVQLRDIGTDFQVYDTSKMLIISFPRLEVGDCFEVKWTVRGKNPEHAGHFFTRYTFGDDRYPVVRDEMRVRLPKERTLKSASVGGRLDPEIKEEAGQRTYHWKVDNRPQLPQDDYLPSKEELRLQVACSTFASWDEVFKWKHNLRKDCWHCTADMRRIVQDVTKGLQTQEDKARALTAWVRRHVRYLSQGEKHDYTPHTPAQVLTCRYGDCKDTSQLLAVMMKEAGIPVALATLGALDDGQVLEQVPSPWGTHAILLATIDGKQHWVDTTTSVAGWDFLPNDDRDRLCYVIDDQGLRLVRTPAMTPEGNFIEQTTRLSIGADGSSHGERSSLYRGQAAYSRRQDWVDVPAGERRRLIAAELLDANGNSRLDRFQIDEALLKDYDQAVKARFQYEIAGHFTGETEKEGSITDSTIWGKMLSVNLDFDRQVALDLGTPFESVHKYVLQLPPALRHDAVAKDKSVSSKWGSFRITVKPLEDGEQIEVTYHTRLEKVRVEPADFDAWRKFHQEVARHYRFWLTLRPTRNLAAAPLLEAQVRLGPANSAAAAILAGLYLANDKTADARRVVAAARAYHPNDQALAELAVKAAGDAKQEEAAYRELVQRFPDQLKYSVELGRCLVDAGRYTAARKVLQAVAKNGQPSEQAQAHYQLARSFFQEDKAKDALKHWEAAADGDEDTVHTVAALLLKARALEKLGQANQAAAAYREALKVDGDSAEALESLFRLELAAKRPTEAIDTLRRYSAAVANDAAGLARAADYHLRLGRLDDAQELGIRAVNEGSKSAARRTLGLVAYQRGKYGAALTELSQVDVDPAVLEALIRSELALGHLGSAIKQAERADKLDKPTPEILDCCKLVVQLQQRRNAVLAAVRVPDGLAAAYAEAADHFICAEQAYGSKGASASEELLKGAFPDGVELGEAYALRGLLALERGRWARAAADAEKAIQLSPKAARGYYLRGRMRLEAGNKDALPDLAKAAELSERKDASILHWLAAALHKDGKNVEALAAQREAVKLRPNDAELEGQLRELEKSGQ
jgi:tetratricopeptide (TPR) repeat protein/transglutaminase-like putative cysteine protease